MTYTIDEQGKVWKVNQPPAVIVIDASRFSGASLPTPTETEPHQATETKDTEPV